MQWLGWLNIAVLLFLTVAGLALGTAFDATSPLVILMAVCLVAFCASYIVVGRALTAGSNRARPVAVVLALLGLLNTPVGTILGGFALAYLFQGEKQA